MESAGNVSGFSERYYGTKMALSDDAKSHFLSVENDSLPVI